LILCLALFVFTAGIIPGFYLEEKIRGKLAWRAYERDARKRGVKLIAAEILPPTIPDSENFASIPLFKAAFQASDADKPVPNPFDLFVTKNEERPKLGNPIKQRTVDLAAWQKFFVDAKRIPEASGDAAADVLSALDTFAEPLAQLRTAGDRPRCRFPVHWEKGFTTPFPHLGILQGASCLYSLRLSAHLARGESAAAYADFSAGWREVTATAAEPALIAALVRNATAVQIENAVWDGLARGQWAEPDLKRIEADLAGVDWLKDCLFAFGSERALSNGMFDLLIDHPDEIGRVGDLKDPQEYKVFELYPAGWNYQSKVRFNRFIDEILARVDPAQGRCFLERPIRSSPKSLPEMPWKMYYLFFALVAPIFEDAESKFAQIGTHTNHCRLACALERFRLARGDYPDRLEDLVPKFLPSLPVEIVNGEPYHYRRLANGRFVLYSVGTDLKDDGGEIDPNAKKQKDWVWRYPAM